MLSWCGGHGAGSEWESAAHRCPAAARGRVSDRERRRPVPQLCRSRADLKCIRLTDWSATTVPHQPSAVTRRRRGTTISDVTPQTAQPLRTAATHCFYLARLENMKSHKMVMNATGLCIFV